MYGWVCGGVKMLIEEAPKYFELHDRSECLAAADGCSVRMRVYA